MLARYGCKYFWNQFKWFKHKARAAVESRGEIPRYLLAIQFSAVQSSLPSVVNIYFVIFVDDRLLMFQILR